MPDAIFVAVENTCPKLPPGQLLSSSTIYGILAGACVEKVNKNGTLPLEEGIKQMQIIFSIIFSDKICSKSIF